MTSTSAAAVLSLPSETEIRVTRTFAAPRELVWKAWTDPAQLARWWGPLGFTTTTAAMNIRPEGTWRFTMHGPDGTDYENLVTYLEVCEPERLVYKHAGDTKAETDGGKLEPVSFTVTATFEPAGPQSDRTSVTLSMVFPSRQQRDFVIKEYGADEGTKQTLARLAEHLDNVLQAGADPHADPHANDDVPFTLSRVFNAPRDLTWRAWTEHDLLTRWFGPKGTTIVKSSLDLRPGGTFHFAMRSTTDAGEHWGLWNIREVARPDRLVFVVSFADAAGKTVRSCFDPKWPLETLYTITFADHAGKGGGTVVHLRSEPINATAEERRVFAAGHGSMNRGWDGTLERLTEILWDRC